MLSKNWRPEWMQATEDEGHEIKPAKDGYVSPHDAERLMVVYQNLSEDWVEHATNASYYKESLKWKRESAYVIAYLKSEGKSDRVKDIEAKGDSEVRMYDLKLIEATVSLKYAEHRLDACIRSHHAMKEILRNAKEEKWL